MEQMVPLHWFIVLLSSWLALSSRVAASDSLPPPTPLCSDKERAPPPGGASVIQTFFAGASPTAMALSSRSAAATGSCVCHMLLASGELIQDRSLWLLLGGCAGVTRNTDFSTHAPPLSSANRCCASPRPAATQKSPHTAENTPKSACFPAMHGRKMPPTLSHVSLLPCAHAAKGTQSMAKWSQYQEVRSGMTVARATCLPPRASPCPRACRSPSRHTQA